MDVPGEAWGSAEWLLAALVTRVPVERWTQLHRQPWRLGPVVWGRSRGLAPAPGGESLQTGWGRSCRARWGAHASFSQAGDSLLDTPTASAVFQENRCNR